MKQCWGIVVFFLLTQVAAAQSPFFQPYYLAKKNDAIKVNKILQDKTGYLWFGTDKGLFKFDGISYRRFLGIDNLPDENVTALAQDSLGRLWAGFKNGKISIVEKNTITSFEPEEGLSKQPVSDILFDKKGALWFSTYNDGVYYYFNNRLYRLDDMDGMPDLYAYDLEEDEQGNIWIGTDGGVAVCSRKGTSVEIKVMNYSTGLPDNIVRKILRGKNNTMWLATEDAGLACVDAVTMKIKSKSTTHWTHGSIADLLVVDDWIWVATDRGRATINVNDQSHAIKIQSTDQVTTLMNDAEGNIWMGSKTGVSRTLGKELQFSELQEDPNMVTVAVGSDGDIWYSTSQGLFRLRKNEVKNIISKPLAGTPYLQKNVISLFTDSEGFVWAGLYGEGAIRINPQNNSIKVFDKELRNGSVLNISGKNKSVWLATLGGATEIKIDKNFAVKNYSQTDGLATDYIYQVFVDSRDRVWFATDRAGVDMRDASGLHHFGDNLISKVVYGFAEDSLHRVYANVQNSGLFVFDEKKFVPFEKQNRLHNLNFNILSSTSQGQLLVAHDLGIDIFDPVKDKFHYFDEETGIRNKIANLNAVARDQQEGLFIGTDHGLMVYYQSKNKRQYTPKPFIDVVEADDEVVNLDKSDHLNYDQNNIKIGFIGFWYQNPAALTFAYQLENYDRDWIITHDYSATYSKLPPGEYVFKLKASDSNDFSTVEEAKIHFVVRPPFWRTAWFYLLAGVAIAIAAYSIMRFRERKLVRDKQELETKVRERTEEIEAKSHEIVAQAEEIRGINENLESLVKERTSELERKNKALEEYAFINAHQLRAPVASILGLINLMQKLELSDDEKIYLEHLQQSAKKLDSVVSSITLAIERGDFVRPSTDDED
jgi:ligand-binding sensor domain-containing protein